MTSMSQQWCNAYTFTPGGAGVPYPERPGRGYILVDNPFVRPSRLEKLEGYHSKSLKIIKNKY